MDSSSSGPDDINDRLAEIAAELAAEGKFKEPSAAERARASVQPAGGGALSRRRNKRLAAELRKPVVPSGQTAPARPPKARVPAEASARNAGTRRGRAGQWSLVILVALGLVAFGVAKLFPSGTPTKPSTAGRPTPTVTPLFTTGNPFAGSPAAAYADDAAGIVLPEAHPVGPYTSAQVAAGYATVKDMLVAALLNRPTMSGHKPIAFGRLLIRQQRSWFYEHLTKPIKRGKGPAWLTWRWVTAFAPGTEVVGSVVKVQGLPMTAKVVTVHQRPALQIYADYIFVYAVQQPGVAASRLRIVAQDYATVQFAQWDDPGGKLEPWVYDFGASYADAQCGTTDGLVHPAFPAVGPGRVAPSGPKVNPYNLGQRPSAACEAVTGT